MEVFIYMFVSTSFTYRVADILYSDFKDDFINKIGKYNVNILNEITSLYIYDFGIFIELSPDEEEKAMLEQNIQMALSKQDINLEDAIDIREIKNLKLANQLLKVKRKAKQEEDAKKDKLKQQAVMQQQMQSQQMAAQVAVTKIEAENQAKIKYRQADVAFEIEKQQKQL